MPAATERAQRTTRATRVALGVVLAAFSFAPLGMAQPRTGGTLVVGLASDLVSPDPHRQTIRQITELVYEPLVELDSTGRVAPGLAVDWHVSEDGLTWTFTLREGVVFHDGSPLRAADVVASIHRILDPGTASPRASDFDMVERVAAPDDLTVSFRLERPFSPILSTLAFSGHAIVRQPSEGADPNGLVGTGPFRLASYTPHASLDLERHESYWKRDEDGRMLPFLDRIDVRIMPDSVVRTTALRYGAIDFINLVPAPDVQVLRSDPKIVLAGGPGSNIRGLALNSTRPPLDDVRVRRAIAHAIDEEQIVRTALFGEAAVARGTAIPSFDPYGIDSSPYVGGNLSAARSLLEAAGHEDGFRMTIYTASAPDFFRAPAELIQADLGRLGIEVDIVVQDFSLWLARTLAADFEAIITGAPNEVDPDANLFAYFHSAGSLNIYGAANEELDRLLEDGRSIADFEARRAAYIAAQEIILDEAYAVFLFHSSTYEAMREEVVGYQHSATGSLLGLRSAWIDR